MDEQHFHPLDYTAVLSRRKWWLIVPVVVCIVAGVLLAMFLPKEYLSQATIGVAAPTLSRELLRGVSSLDKEERQRAISAAAAQLDGPAARGARREDRSRQARWTRPRRGCAPTSARTFRLPQPIGKQTDTQKGTRQLHPRLHRQRSARRAQRIANRLAYVFAEENSKQQLERSENTSEILSQQVQASQARLARLEGQLREKKQAYMGRLPDQVNANVQMVNGLRSQLESISTQLRGEQDRLSMVETQIEQMKQGTGGEAFTCLRSRRRCRRRRSASAICSSSSSRCARRATPTSTRK